MKLSKSTIPWEYLADNNEMMRMYHGAVKHGIISSSEYDRLNYFTAAEEALASDIEDCGKLFVALVKEHRWNELSDASEQRAITRIKEIDGIGGNERTYQNDYEEFEEKKQIALDKIWERKKAIKENRRM